VSQQTIPLTTFTLCDAEPGSGVDDAVPSVDARLAAGSRVHAVLGALAAVLFPRSHTPLCWQSGACHAFTREVRLWWCFVTIW
jgi:hypothetical protein